MHTEQCCALDLATGAVMWRTPARRRWATPGALRIGTLELIVLGGGEVLRAGDGMVVADENDCQCNSPLLCLGEE